MAIPILGKRRERRQQELTAAIEAVFEKAGSPALGSAPQMAQIMTSGATYPVGNPSSPFAQTGGYGTAFNPLPRPPGVFDSLFGPANPLTPDPLDRLDSEGRSAFRRWQYPVTTNVNLLDRETPWTVLRRIATEVDVVNRCIELIQDSLCGQEWSWGFSPQIINQIMSESGETNSAKATSIARQKYGDELNRIQQFWEYPDKLMGYSFEQMLNLMVWAHLTYDGIAVVPTYTLGGELMALSCIDTATIKILLDNRGFLPQSPAPAYQQILYGFPRGEAQAQEMDGNKPPTEYTDSQLAYYIRRPRLHSVYGYSTVEECINFATLYMNRQEWMHAEWSNGVTPKLVVTIDGTDTWTPEQTAYYQNAITDQWAGQSQRRQGVWVMRPGMSVTQLKEMAESYSNQYDEWLIMQIGAKFGIPQSQLGIQMKSSIGGGSQTKEQTSQSDKFATDALVKFLIGCFNDLSRRFMGVGPEITMTCTGGNDSDDDLTRAQADASDVGSGIRTRNEIRAERGIPLINEPEADQLAVTTGTGVTFLPGQLAVQEEQQQASIVGAQNAQQATPGETDLQGQPANQAPPQNGKTPVQNNAKTSSNNGNSKTSAKDDTRQPDASNSDGDDSRQPDAQKELAAFARFAKGRITNNRSWREFKFNAVHPQHSAYLNSLGASGDIDAVIKATSPTAAGILVRSAATGRVLLVQRSVSNKSTAAGLFEIPGGRLENGEDAWTAAQREWSEELNQDLPDGKKEGSWTTPSGNYVGWVYEIDDESDVDLSEVKQTKEVENAAWFDPQALRNNAATRLETDSLDWSLLSAAKSLNEVAEMHRLAKDSSYGEEGTDALRQWYNDGADGAINWGSDGDFEACVAVAGKYIDNPEGYCNERHQDATGAPPGHAPGESEAEKSLVLSADELAAMVKDRLAPDMAQLIESAKRIDDVKARFEHSELLAALGRPAAPVQPIVHVYNEPPEIRVPDVHVNVDAPDFSKAKAPVVQVTPEINVNIPEQPAPQISFTPEIHVDAAQVNIPAPIVNVDVAAPEVTVTPEINVASPTIKIPKGDPPNVTVQVPAAPQPRKMTAYKRSTGEIVVEATPETK